MSAHRRRLRSKRADPDNATPLRDQSRLLSQAIQNLSSPQRVYMPGASAFLDEVDPTAVTEAPEGVKIWFPSQLPPGSREKSCIANLPHLEFRFRLAQAYDALDLIRRLRGVYQVLLMKNRVHVSKSQGTTTRSKALFANFALKIDQAAACYRDARVALLRLDPNGDIHRWKEDLRELRRTDIRGPSREDDETSESHQQLSWIWQTSSLEPNAGINDPKLRGIMRVEWCKAVARAERFEEEVELTVEEMRRTLLSFRGTADRWEQLGKARVGEPLMDGDTTAGVRAYASRQAALYRRLVDAFVQDWYECLELKSLGSDWLSGYPRPDICRRRRLRSNVEAYHLSNADVAGEALANDPLSDGEEDLTGHSSDVEMGFFDDA